MGTRGSWAAALVAIALLSGCTSFAEGLEEAADAAGATSASREAEASGPSSAATSTPSAATTGAAPTTAQPGATTAAPPAPTTQAAPAPGTTSVTWPRETTLQYGQAAWGVYLIVAEDYSAAEEARMQRVHRDLQALGYRGFSGTLCDAGADAAGVEEFADAVSVYFRTRPEAEKFIAGWNRPYVGYAQVATYCEA